MDIKEYKRKFKALSTGYLLSHYKGFNEEYRKYAREEFKRRRIPVSKLPYKTRRKSRKDPLKKMLGHIGVY